MATILEKFRGFGRRHLDYICVYIETNLKFVKETGKRTRRVESSRGRAGDVSSIY